MTFQIRKASRKQSKLRLALVGPSGSGKTWWGLRIATQFAEGKRPLVIDSENRSSDKFADIFAFDVLDMEDNYSPDKYSDAIKYGVAQGYGVIVVDSLSHAWFAPGGSLDLVDRAAKRYSDNRWAAWSDVTPKQNALVHTIVHAKAHLIVTMRSKTEWVVQEDSRGKKKPVKVGLGAIQRDGLEYEFDIVGQLTQENNLWVDKSRMSTIQNEVFRPEEDEKFALKVFNWMNEGEEVEEEYTRQDLIDFAKFRFNMEPADIGSALNAKDLEFDGSRWEEMTAALEEYANAEV